LSIDRSKEFFRTGFRGFAYLGKAPAEQLHPGSQARWQAWRGTGYCVLWPRVPTVHTPRQSVLQTGMGMDTAWHVGRSIDASMMVFVNSLLVKRPTLFCLVKHTGLALPGQSDVCAAVREGR